MNDKLIGAKIKYLMELRNIKQEQVAKILGKTQSSISLKLKGERKFTPSELKLVANFFNKTVDYFYSSSLDPDDAEPLPSIGDHVRRVPLYAIEGGHAINFNGTNYPTDRTNDYVLTDSREERVFAARLHGSSMAPRFGEGDVLLFSSTAKVSEGDFVLFQTVHQDSSFKQVFFDDYKQQYKFHPLNADYPDKTYKKEEVTLICRLIERRESF